MSNDCSKKPNFRRGLRWQRGLPGAVCAAFLVLLSIPALAADGDAASADALTSEIRQLKEMILNQQAQIDELRRLVGARATTPTAITADQNTSAPWGAPAPAVASSAVAAAQDSVPSQLTSTSSAQLAGSPIQDATIAKTLSTLTRNLGGFRFSGDLRLRFDLQSRAGNPVGAPLQNARERYRLRLNVDRDFFGAKDSDRSLFRAHAQLATAPLNNPLTMDTDFTGVDTRAAISLSEAWVDFTPTKSLAFRAGRTTEIFADNLQYIFDDDVRFNGFHESYRLAGKRGSFFEVRAGQYILTNPNTPIVPAGSAYLNAGYQLGQRVPSAGLFDQGVTAGSNLGRKWRHAWTGNYLVVREPNQIQLASTTAGFSLLTSPEFGSSLTGPLPQPGNATTTPGGAIYSAGGFHILRGAFQLNYAGREFAGHNFPFRLFVQGTRNVRASTERSGFAAGATLGQATRLGDVLVQYAYLYKPANALVSQFTDDDVGTGTGVNLRTHAIRLDFGLTRYATWENRLYIQNPISHSNPAANFFVPYERGANTTVRWQSQFLFTF